MGDLTPGWKLGKRGSLGGLAASLTHTLARPFFPLCVFPNPDLLHAQYMEPCGLFFFFSPLSVLSLALSLMCN